MITFDERSYQAVPAAATENDATRQTRPKKKQWVVVSAFVAVMDMFANCLRPPPEDGDWAQRDDNNYNAEKDWWQGKREAGHRRVKFDKTVKVVLVPTRGHILSKIEDKGVLYYSNAEQHKAVLAVVGERKKRDRRKVARTLAKTAEKEGIDISECCLCW